MQAAAAENTAYMKRRKGAGGYAEKNLLPTFPQAKSYQLLRSQYPDWGLKSCGCWDDFWAFFISVPSDQERAR